MPNHSPADVRNIQGMALTVYQLLNGRKYGLGYYQREYAWKDVNVKELIDDLSTSFLEDYHENDERSKVASYRPYFLGPIVTNQDEDIRYLVDVTITMKTITCYDPKQSLWGFCTLLVRSCHFGFFC